MAGKPRNLATLSREEMKAFLCSFDTIVLDCDGVVWMPGKEFPRTDHVIKRLRELGKKIIFFSNNSMSTRDDYILKFSKHGIPIEKDDIVLPTVITGDYLKCKNFSKKVYLVGSNASQKEIESFGIRVIRERSSLAEPTIMELLKAMSEKDPDVGAVVMDVDVNINYLKMMKGVAYLQDPCTLMLVTATEYKIPFAGPMAFIGPGYFSDTVKSVSGKEPIIMGKPSLAGGEYLKKTHHVVPERTLMIGDTISHDIGFASNCGYISLFVLSGVNTLDDIGKESFVPDYYISSLHDMAPLLP
ncbi:4-nitrophenylphosphatase-like isoform X3 [Ischnura elegans]|nr:4-nitrophenylphosphatase-like isoform X3 [Ischnura elegans]XP_046386275.1 4-nitrophenylphosphatase-like isoform X3 [Ischnura elegans]